MWSATSNAPCVCHSDVKPQDIYLVDEHRRLALIDFDNVFSFIPEFDLCKLHFGLVAAGVNIELDEYARMVKFEAGGSASADDISGVSCRFIRTFAVGYSIGQFHWARRPPLIGLRQS